MPEKKDELTKEIDEVVRAAQREIIEKNRATHRRLIEYGFRAGVKFVLAEVKEKRS